MMKKMITVLAATLAVVMAVTSCKDMDDNYKEYLENIPTYAPPVRNLTAVSAEPGMITLNWDLIDDTQLVKSIRIVVKKTDSDIQTFDIPEVVMSYTVTGLELQAYDFSVYTIDGFGNLSIPITKTFTPIPGRE